MTISHEISLFDPCEETVSTKQYGYDTTSLWVSGGCRAEFNVCYEKQNELESPYQAIADACTVIPCSSSRNKYDKCTVPQARMIQDVTPLSQQSQTDCTTYEEYNMYGYSANSIWTTGGCVADFRVCYIQNSVFNRGYLRRSCRTITCGEENGVDRCFVPFSKHIVEMNHIKQISDKTCHMRDQVDKFGYGTTSVWVKGGCRGEFQVCYAKQTPEDCDELPEETNGTVGTTETD
ncbi:hypothetical protein ScPMuIL_002045 [Solemya velum]